MLRNKQNTHTHTHTWRNKWLCVKNLIGKIIHVSGNFHSSTGISLEKSYSIQPGMSWLEVEAEAATWMAAFREWAEEKAVDVPRCSIFTLCCLQCRLVGSPIKRQTFLVFLLNSHSFHYLIREHIRGNQLCPAPALLLYPLGASLTTINFRFSVP